MRVIFTNRYFYPDHSATSQMLSDLAFFLAGAGHEVCVVTSCQRYDDAAAGLPPRARIDGVDVHRVRTTRFGRDKLVGRALDYVTFYLAAGWALWRLTRAGDVLVAKTDPPLISVVAAMVARWRGARLVNWVQDVFPEVAEALGVRALGGPQAEVLRWLRNWAFGAAAANVVLGERMAEVVGRAGRMPERTRVIPNWADMEAIRPVAAADNPLRREWGLDGKFVVCYSGNMGRVHEFDTILDAAQGLAGGAAAVVFLFIGDGAQRRMLEDQVHRRGLANVQFRPYQDRAGLSFSLCVGDMHLVSQRPEVEGYVFPSKLYGILAAGRPVVFVGDPEGEISQLIERDGIGAAVRQGDAVGLAEQLLRLQGDAALREAMGARARALLCERYDKRIAFMAWAALLGDLPAAKLTG
ncbi:MAG: glycosyltransferase family 4 protein [Burkholderiales bacterium]|nr:glycosyltransferase family 4 protein [Burkholderiales bacterium]